MELEVGVLSSPGQKVEWCWALWWRFCCAHLGPRCAELLCNLPLFPPCAHPPVWFKFSWDEREKGRKKKQKKKHHILDVQIKKTSSLLHTTNCCWLPPMLVRLWVSWWALTSSCTSRGIAPCSRKALWLAGQRARLRIRPTVAYKGRNIWHI